MKLYLMRHGDAEDGLYDDIRPLSSAGVLECEAVGTFFKLVNEIPDIIYHSPLLRSRQSALKVAEKAGFDGVICERDGLLPEDSAISFERELPVNLKGNILVVGHLPFLGYLVPLLLTGTEGGLGLRFSTGSVICLERSSALMERNLRYFMTAKLISKLMKSNMS